MNVTALLGSPRRNGTTAAVVKELLRGAESSGHRCESIFLGTCS